MTRTDVTLRWVVRGAQIVLQQQVLEYEEIGYPPKKRWVDVPVRDENEQTT